MHRETRFALPSILALLAGCSAAGSSGTTGDDGGGGAAGGAGASGAGGGGGSIELDASAGDAPFIGSTTCDEAQARHDYIGCDFWPNVHPNVVKGYFDFAASSASSTAPRSRTRAAPRRARRPPSARGSSPIWES